LLLIGGQAHERRGSGVGATGTGCRTGGGAPRTSSGAGEGFCPHAAHDSHRSFVGGHDPRGGTLQ